MHIAHTEAPPSASGAHYRHGSQYFCRKKTQVKPSRNTVYLSGKSRGIRGTRYCLQMRLQNFKIDSKVAVCLGCSSVLHWANSTAIVII